MLRRHMAGGVVGEDTKAINEHLQRGIRLEVVDKVLDHRQLLWFFQAR